MFHVFLRHSVHCVLMRHSNHATVQFCLLTPIFLPTLYTTPISCRPSRLHRLADTARIVGLYSRIYVTIRDTVSVSLSVCLSYLSTASLACGVLLLWTRRAGGIDQQRLCAPARRSAANTSRAVSCCQLTYEAEHPLV